MNIFARYVILIILILCTMGVKNIHTIFILFILIKYYEIPFIDKILTNK